MFWRNLLQENQMELRVNSEGVYSPVVTHTRHSGFETCVARLTPASAN
jgi:hypothetical protein